MLSLYLTPKISKRAFLWPSNFSIKEKGIEQLRCRPFRLKSANKNAARRQCLYRAVLQCIKASGRNINAGILLLAPLSAFTQCYRRLAKIN